PPLAPRQKARLLPLVGSQAADSPFSLFDDTVYDDTVCGVNSVHSRNVTFPCGNIGAAHKISPSSILGYGTTRGAIRRLSVRLQQQTPHSHYCELWHCGAAAANYAAMTVPHLISRGFSCWRSQKHEDCRLRGPVRPRL